MTRIQFGWSLPSGPPEGMSRNAYMEGVQKGFELIKGHLDENCCMRLLFAYDGSV